MPTNAHYWGSARRKPMSKSATPSMARFWRRLSNIHTSDLSFSQHINHTISKHREHSTCYNATPIHFVNLAMKWGEAPPVSSTEYLTQYHTPFLTMHGSDKLPWGRGLCIGMCNQCRATSSLSHPINEHSHGWQALANHHSAHWP